MHAINAINAIRRNEVVRNALTSETISRALTKSAGINATSNSNYNHSMFQYILIFV